MSIATVYDLWPQQVPWLPAPTHLSGAVGRYHVQAYPPVLASYVESATVCLHVQRVLTVHHPLSQCPQISKWISLTYSQGIFQTAVLFFAGSWNEQNLMWALSKRVFSVLWDQPDWFSKPDIPGAHVSSNDPRGQGTSCRAPTPCLSSRSTCLVRSLPCVPSFHIILLPTTLGVGIFFTRLSLPLLPFSRWSP